MKQKNNEKQAKDADNRSKCLKTLETSASNNNSNILSINQVLKVPAVILDTTTIYTVKSGDSLYSIANKYNTTIDIIKDVNNLTSNVLSINQVLKIPTSTTSNITNYNNYTVVKGDSLYSIANFESSFKTLRSFLRTNLRPSVMMITSVLSPT